MSVRLVKSSSATWFAWCEQCHPKETDYDAHWQGPTAAMTGKRHAQASGHTVRAIQELSVRWKPA